ncbi:hypothetical protein KCU71_g18551, partial [Aureobasidium melanogenum]
MAGRRAVARRALQSVYLQSGVSRPTLATTLRLGQTANTCKLGGRKFHLSARQLKPATASALSSTATEYPTTHDQIQQPIDTQNFLDN